jgi:hypothetical protein
MDTFLSVAPQLAVAAFMFYVIKWLAGHFDPHVTRLLDSIDDIRETGQRMADIGERLVRLVETQQVWQENLDTTLFERHKRIMERFDKLETSYMWLLQQIKEECPCKGENNEGENNE